MLQFLPFTETMLPAASALLAQRHARARTLLPELPVRFEAPEVAAQALALALAKPSASAVAALRDGQLVAYLIGETSVQPWGRCGYIYLPGYGLAQGEDPASMQELYALLGEVWNQRGCFNHYAYICAADRDIVEAWFNLGFGKERVDALLDLRLVEIPALATPAGIEIRQVGTGDGAYLAGLSDTIWRHQSRAPRWHPILPEDSASHAEGWAEIAETATDLAFLAFAGEEAIGSLAFYVEAEQADALLIPPGCRYMTAAATKASARGRGVGTALTWHGLHQIRAHGDRYCQTNWQSANLLAARFWPRFGFTPVAFRLARRIDPNIVWAKG